MASLRSGLRPDGVYGRNLANKFRLGEAPSLVSRSLPQSLIAVTKIVCPVANNGLTSPIPRQDAVLVTLQLQDCPEHELWMDGTPMKTGSLAAGTTCIYDLRLSPVVNSISPFRNLHFFLPYSALAAVSEDFRLLTPLPHNPGIGLADSVLRHLGATLLPLFDRRPDAASILFVDHIATAVAAYISRLLIGKPASKRQYRLARWQTNRSKDLLMSESPINASIAHLAKECDLSIEEFSRQFHFANGVRPHQWVIKQQLERARQLLRQGENLSTFATLCGFAGDACLLQLLHAQK